MEKIDRILSFRCLRKTPFGMIAIIWSDYRSHPKVLRIMLPKSGISTRRLVKASFPDSISSSCDEIDVIADKIVAFLTGNDIRLPLDIVRLDSCSDFQQKVLLAEYEIPRGCVSTYRRIARHIGIPNGARAVGSALATNPFPIVIPCHRAIRSDGTLGGYQGGLQMKRALLEMEGIHLDVRGRVILKEFFY
jgi:methylated-DNA-[protein]-cysteine S-methyltransferase